MYKLHPLGIGVISTETGACIPNDPKNTDWVMYQQWLVQGNTVAPSRTRDEQQTHVAELIEEEANSRVDAATSENPREKRKTLARAIKLSRREAKGVASAEEIAELDNQEAISEYIDEVASLADSRVSWIKSEVPTGAELETFDPKVGVSWPNPPMGA